MNQKEMVMADRPKSAKGQIRVGFYDIERTIGKGDFAVVKLAKHRITKTEVGFQFQFVDSLQLCRVPFPAPLTPSENFLRFSKFFFGNAD